MSAQSHPGAVVGPKGLTVRPLRRVRGWSSERRETVRSLSVVGVGAVLGYEDRDGRVSMVYQLVTPVWLGS